MKILQETLLQNSSKGQQGESKMMKCKICGKDYVKSKNKFFATLPESIREKVEYIPDCNCLEDCKEKELEELERKRILSCIKNRVKKYKDISVMDNKFLKSRFENADMESNHMQLAKMYVENFLKKDKPIGLLFYGGVGTGKTFVTACIANYLMEKGKTVLVINLGLYLNKLSREWGDAEKIFLEQAESCDLIIIDDFGTEKGLNENQTGWKAEKIYNLIDARYRSEKPLIISTNLNYNKNEEKCEMTEKFSMQGQNRIRDRIIDICFPVQVAGKSRRGMTQERFSEFIADKLLEEK